MNRILIMYRDIDESILIKLKECLNVYLTDRLKLYFKVVFSHDAIVKHICTDIDEVVLLCSSSTYVERDILQSYVHIIPIVFDEIKESKNINPSIQNINYFVFDKSNSCINNSTELLCETILSKIGLIKNTRKIFISYKRSETYELAELVRKVLLKEGYSVFLDKSDIDVGSDFMQEIRYSIADSDVFLMLDSKTYLDSLYTKKELYAACISGVSIVVLSNTNCDNKSNLNGLPRVIISSINELSKDDELNLLTVIREARMHLWKSRHNRLANKLHLLSEKDITLHGACVPSRTFMPHYNIFFIVGIPTTMDFQKVKQKEDNQGSKVYAFYDNLTLPSTFSRHLDWLDKEMNNVNILKTSTFEQVMSEMHFLHLHNSKTNKPIVFLSASVPNEGDNQYDYLRIHDIVTTLTETIIKTDGILVFGGHPTITPIIANIMEIMSEIDSDMYEKKYPSIYLYQSKYFEGEYPLEVKSFPKGHLIETDKMKDKDFSLKRMREEMIKSQSFNCAFFIGGKYNPEIQNPQDSGVWKEFELFNEEHPNAKCYYSEKTGEVPALLFEQYGIEGIFEKITVEDLPRKLLQ